MIYQNEAFENPEFKKEYAFGNAVKELKISQCLRKSNVTKSKGHSAYEIFQFLLLLVFRGRSLYVFLNSKKKDMGVDDNTYYRFLNSCRYHWQRFLTLLSVRVITYFDTLTGKSRVRALVLDDSVIAHNRSKKTELLSYVYDHVIHKTVKGFCMLTLGWTDSYSFIPVGFNMLASADPKKRINEAARKDRRSRGHKCRTEAVMKKPEAALLLIRNALNAGIPADYVLTDTWFTNEPFIKSVTGEGINIIGMLKDMKQKYLYNGREYSLKQLARMIRLNRNGNLFGSVTVRTKNQKIPVKIIFVRNRNNKNEYITILTTDCAMKDSEAVRIYGNRWSIETFFRSAKSLLRLGTEFHGLNYDMIVCGTTVVFTRFILLEWLRRKENDSKTVCELFFVCCDDIQDMELATALAYMVSVFSAGIANGTVRIADEIKRQLINWYLSQPAFIRDLFPDLMWEV